MLIAATLLAAQLPATDPPMSAVETAIKDGLIDGESARWRWFPARQTGAVVTYCGFVNAKNRMGGYTGFNPVWVVGSWSGAKFIPTTIEFAAGPYLDGLAARQCIAAGYNMRVIPPAQP